MLKEFITGFVTNEYLIALIYFILFFIVIRISAYILEKIILRLTMKTKTDLDDLIVKSSSKPITFLAIMFGLRISLDQIAFSEILQRNINLIIDSLIIFAFAYLAYKIINLSFTRVMHRVAKRAKTKPNEGLIQLTKSALQVVMVLGALIYLLSILGFEIGPFLTGLGIGGIAIAFALQESLGNVFGGISIILDKSVNVGDLVTLEDKTSGKISKIGIRSTKIQTFDNETVIVPNSKLANSNINNIAQPNPIVRVVVPFGVAYGSDVEKVKKIVIKEIKSVSNFIENPEPSIRFMEMGESSLNFKAFFFVDSFDNRLSALDEANTKIYKALNKAGVEIPFPQLDVHLKK